MFLTNNPFSDHGPSKQVLSEAIKYHIPEEIPANERTAFHGAAAAAAKAGKKNFNFGGKTHPVTMKKDLANKIADQKEADDYHYSTGERVKKKEKKEAVKYPHMMYDPKTGKEVTAKTPMDHAKFSKMGYTHEKPQMKEDPAHYAAIAKANARKQAERDKADPEAAKKRKEFQKKIDKMKPVRPGDIGRHSSQGGGFVGRRNEETMTFREKLISIIEGDRAAHYKGATKPEEYDEKQKSSKGAMDMLKTPKSIEADGMKAAKDTADNIKKSAPGKKLRKGDQNKGDLTIKPSATPVKDPAAKMQTAESYGILGKAMPNSLLDAINKVVKEK